MNERSKCCRTTTPLTQPSTNTLYFGNRRNRTTDLDGRKKGGTAWSPMPTPMSISVLESIPKTTATTQLTATSKTSPKRARRWRWQWRRQRARSKTRGRMPSKFEYEGERAHSTGESGGLAVTVTVAA